ncbi:DNA repair protein RadA [Fulvivirgaceae bacterium BMA10]|uniref:DNA repair protein RadA n=1 Tax=Splendidivirga corallicola TaxID=3051826 RepID=A0ABT8KUD5_9BACT|nr:DNA repair protein RadA [Fulvivirgaceae bacterium BMA10]
MAKVKTAFFCQNCGNQYAKWQGKCSACNEWNTIVEEVIVKESNTKSDWRPGNGNTRQSPKPKKLQEIDFQKEDRIVTSDKELNRVLGGGIVSGSLILIGGEPGIGKSTLMLQLALRLTGKKVLYVSGEESDQQIKMRAQRLGFESDNCFILTETSTQSIFQQIESLHPEILIIDSIQTLHTAHVESAAGSVSQVRETAAELIKYAKESGTPVFLIGHITKEGSIAGPKILEHMVDTVLQFEGDRHLAYRILRTTKNRFGSTSELGIYEMQGSGLREVSNPSEILISQREHDLSGVTIGATMEGNRPLLIEIQALVSPAAYGTPQRSTTGFDAKRLNMLLAVLEKRGNFRLGTQDVFLNIAGGLKVEDPALDLAVCAAIISSLEEIPVSDKICFAAEVGLGGELRAVNKVDHRISEAEKLGFEEIHISKFGKKNMNMEQHQIRIKSFGKLIDVFSDLFG